MAKEATLINSSNIRIHISAAPLKNPQDRALQKLTVLLCCFQTTFSVRVFLSFTKSSSVFPFDFQFLYKGYLPRLTEQIVGIKEHYKEKHMLTAADVVPPWTVVNITKIHHGAPRGITDI